jgi:hypothetical protein
VGQDADWEIKVVAMTVDSVNRQKLGVALSVTFLAIYQSESIKTICQMLAKDGNIPDPFEGQLSSKQRENLYKMVSNPVPLCKVFGHFIQVGQDIQALCRIIIAKFDSEQLEPDRKLIQSIADYEKKRNTDSQRRPDYKKNQPHDFWKLFEK